MIKEKRLIKISSIILIILVGVYIGIYMYDNDNINSQDEIAKVIEINNINVRNIAAIAISNSKSTFGFLNGENGITLESGKDQGNYSQEEMQAFIYTMSKLVSIRTIGEYQNLSDFGLDKPVSEITIIETNGFKTKYSLGNQNSVDKNYYLLREDDEKVFLIEAEVAQLMLYDESNFWDKRILPKINPENIDLIESINIYSKKTPERSYTLLNQGEHVFQLIEPIENPVGTDTVFSDIILPMTAIYPERVIEENADLTKYALNNPDFIINLNFNTMNYELKISQNMDGKFYITKTNENTVYEIPAEQAAFLQVDYMDILNGVTYNCNVTKIKTLTFTDYIENKDYNFDLSGEATGIRAIIDGNAIEYGDFMDFYSKINSIRITNKIEDLEEMENITDLQPYFAIYLNKKNGSIDVLEFIQKDKSESYVRINGIINFTTFNKSATDIINNIKELIK